MAFYLDLKLPRAALEVYLPISPSGEKLPSEYQMVTKTYLKPTYLPTYATVVTVVTVVTLVRVVTVVTKKKSSKNFSFQLFFFFFKKTFFSQK